MLNLFNNAFYAVYEKFKKLGSGYTPIVAINTKKVNTKIKIEINVQDNGMDISKS